MRDSIEPIICLLLLMAFGIGMFCLVPTIHKWEVENNYPYGKLCSVFTTCK